MVCYHPLKGHFSPENGRFVPGYTADVRLRSQIPCGSCIGCRQTYARSWAIRCMHESKSHVRKCFITLTYNDDSLPNPPSLVTKHFQDFMKRLRINFARGISFQQQDGNIRHVFVPDGIKVYYCGEYGPRYSRRPHWHAVLFGAEFPDKTLHKRKKSGNLYRSQVLQGLWPHGFITVADLTFESAGYCARYAMKKVNGQAKKAHYQWRCPHTGHVYDLKPEHAHMSRRGGIGLDWIKRYWKDVYPSDEIILKGNPVKPPKFYDTFLKKLDPVLYANVKRKRMDEVRVYSDVELDAMKQHHRQRLQRLKRVYECGDTDPFCKSSDNLLDFKDFPSYEDLFGYERISGAD